jgi:imidazolonepropionase-like amidohydrolase
MKLIKIIWLPGLALFASLSALSGCSDDLPISTDLQRSEGQPFDTIIRCGALIDGISDEPLSRRDIAVRDGRVVAINAVGSIPDNSESPILIDLSELTCLPGLINTHVHFDGNPEDSVDYSIYARRTADETLQLVLDNAKTTLLTGFTTVRHMGAWFPDTIYRARALIEKGQALGPRIQTAGPYLTIPGGGGDLTFPEIPSEKIPAESQQGIASTPQEFADRAEAAIAAGADFLKVIASGAVFSLGTPPGAPEMSRADIEAVVAVAKRYGKKVTAHVHSDQSGQDAILAGVDSLEHASLLEDSTITLAAERGVAFSMDVYNGTYTDTIGREQGYPEVFLKRNIDTTEAQRVVFEKAYREGVTLLYGTDAAVLPHHMGGWQFAIMIERGMRPMDAIRSATSVAAHHMGLSRDIGAIVSGRTADLIAVRGDPLTDPKRLRQVDVVIQGGTVIKLPDDLLD